MGRIELVQEQIQEVRQLLRGNISTMHPKMQAQIEHDLAAGVITEEEKLALCMSAAIHKLALAISLYIDKPASVVLNEISMMVLQAELRNELQQQREQMKSFLGLGDN